MQNEELSKKMALVAALRRTALNRERERLGQKLIPVPLMAYVLEHPGCTQGEVAGFLYISAASVATSCKRLEKEGLLERRVDPVNRRKNQLFVTAAGETLTREKRAMFERVNARAFADIDEGDRETFARVLDKMLDNLGGRDVDPNQVFGPLMEAEKRKEKK
ncbi:MAG: winged helix-turn-helix transcriptional regulator [Oscillospiraceae bacterium]|nr:winged helix-turn-helix transcriptional regulator [Oscillospiraceae bacterium]